MITPTLKKMNRILLTIEGNRVIGKRIFNATLDLVWRAWTEAELLDQWWAPEPYRSETSYMDFREGGYRLYAMVSPEDERHWGRTSYDSISQLESFAGTDGFCDEKGVGNPDFPLARYHNQFIAHSQGTEVIFTTEYDSAADIEAIVQMGFEEGMDMAYQNLDALLAKLGAG